MPSAGRAARIVLRLAHPAPPQPFVSNVCERDPLQALRADAARVGRQEVARSANRVVRISDRSAARPGTVSAVATSAAGATGSATAVTAATMTTAEAVAAFVALLLPTAMVGEEALASAAAAAALLAIAGGAADRGDRDHKAEAGHQNTVHHFIPLVRSSSLWCAGKRNGIWSGFRFSEQPSLCGSTCASTRFSGLELRCDGLPFTARRSCGTRAVPEGLSSRTNRRIQKIGAFGMTRDSSTFGETGTSGSFEGCRRQRVQSAAR